MQKRATARIELLVMLGLVVIVAALSARWSPHPVPPVLSEPSGLSIEGIHLADQISKWPDAFPIMGGEFWSSHRGKGKRFMLFKAPSNFSWSAKVQDDQVISISGTHLELYGKPLLKASQSTIGVASAMEELSFSTAPGTFCKMNHRERRGSRWVYSWGRTCLEINLSSDNKVEYLELFDPFKDPLVGYHPGPLL